MKPRYEPSDNKSERKQDKKCPITLTRVRALNSEFMLADLFDGQDHQEIIVLVD